MDQTLCLKTGSLRVRTNKVQSCGDPKLLSPTDSFVLKFSHVSKRAPYEHT